MCGEHEEAIKLNIVSRKLEITNQKNFVRIIFDLI